MLALLACYRMGRPGACCGRRDRAFTVLELLVAVVILGVVLLIVWPPYHSVMSRTRKAARVQARMNHDIEIVLGETSPAPPDETPSSAAPEHAVPAKHDEREAETVIATPEGTSGQAPEAPYKPYAIVLWAFSSLCSLRRLRLRIIVGWRNGSLWLEVYLEQFPSIRTVCYIATLNAVSFLCALALLCGGGKAFAWSLAALSIVTVVSAVLLPRN